MGVPLDSRGACPVAFSHLAFEGGAEHHAKASVCKRTMGLLLCNFVTFHVGLNGKFYVLLPLPSTYRLIYVWSCLCGGEGVLP